MTIGQIEGYLSALSPGEETTLLGIKVRRMPNRWFVFDEHDGAVRRTECSAATLLWSLSLTSPELD